MLAELTALRREVADLRALVSRLICAGEVLDTDPAGHRVKVRLPGADDVTTAWLPVLTSRAKGTRVYALPTVGEQVWCGFLPSGGLESGAVFGSSYNQKDATPADSGDVWRVEFADGAHLAHDGAAGTLTLDSQGPMTVQSVGAMALDSQGPVSVQAAGAMALETGAVLGLTAAALSIATPDGGAMDVGSGCALVLRAPSITLDTPVVTCTGDVVVSGISFLGHAHDRVVPGGGLSGTPVA